ncbi:hypothetical protein PAAG_11557 [Paracoccidioides lutzii Pb01]|uniref:Uncharacterized protein n=1 Tax=Paracoccidioides lutzii (strain ATCC MYA-826 / Pb01) TaxID=502779 RepID=A0A0A2V6J9_PARBA|nr:hypothetical protein PAAG_11557 [Paracoccidioides lutzii Pb01]KGQ01710.1 hypothetical protein PAAG_11557 [Paracoccidioides lutzii Pb01]
MPFDNGLPPFRDGGDDVIVDERMQSWMNEEVCLFRSSRKEESPVSETTSPFEDSVAKISNDAPFRSKKTQPSNFDGDRRLSLLQPHTS